jgi:hypothetical protein
MKIDIISMSYDDLVELNNKIVARLKFLDSVRAHKQMMRFNPGDQICFDSPGRGRQFGTLVKYNKKTVTVITESGERWNVSPHLLNKVKSAAGHKNKPKNIIDFRMK